MSATIALQMTGARRIVAMPLAAVLSASLQVDQLLPVAALEHQVIGVAAANDEYVWLRVTAAVRRDKPA